MGCNCKQVRKIEDIYNHLNGNDLANNKISYNFLYAVQNFINNMIYILLTVILFPLIVLDVMLNLLFTFKGNSTIAKLLVKYIKEKH